MIEGGKFVESLVERGVRFFTGVSDSVLAGLIHELGSPRPSITHVIAANEGAAVGLAVGHHLATGKPAVVYLQNSGLGNAVNPLLSIAHGSVYAIPMLLVVGWRGGPGKPDEPQHRKQGEVTEALLTCMDIPYRIVDPERNDCSPLLDEAFAHFREIGTPFALLVTRGAFAGAAAQARTREASLVRETAVATVMRAARESDRIVATTGMIGRELLAYRRANPGPSKEFLNAGGMGHASAISLGIALANPGCRVVCLDGDGALLMHLGTAATIGCAGVPNLIHLVLNNGCHDSVGGHPTVADQVDLCSLARSVGYRQVQRVWTEDELHDLLTLAGAGPIFGEVLVKDGHRANLPRPEQGFRDIKREFMTSLGVRKQ